MINTTIAHYKVTAKLGQGGMGEVYRATDTKLDRDVAIKVLPDEFAQQPERLARFQREAKVLAALNHPNVAAIYGFEKDRGKSFLVMELAQGQTLSELISRDPLPVSQALEIFQQIAQALEAAHDANIIHRDLKPANVIIGPEGRVKVLDFGLAKAMRTSSDSPAADAATATLTDQSTLPGKIVGTAGYMSPEQSRGHEVDKRTDVWAFGCCLYEALTGRQTFTGQTTSDLLAAILKTDPDFSILPLETPREIVTLLRRCLEKDPRRRLRYLGDIALTLDEVGKTGRETSSTPPTAHPSIRGEFGWGKLAIAAGIGAAIMLAVSTIQQWGSPSPDTDSMGSIRSVALLPFENLRPEDSEYQWLAEAMPDAILERLGHLDDLLVKRGRSTLKQSNRSAAEAGRDLEVDAIVTGTFVRHENTLLFNASLIERTTEEVTPMGSINCPVTNVIPVQNTLATDIAGRIRMDLSDQERQNIARSRGIDPRAYAAFRRGLEFYDRLDNTGFELAEAEFLRAKAIDYDYVDPYVYLAQGKWVRLIWGGTRIDPQGGFSEAEVLLEKASQLDPVHSGVLSGQGWIAMLMERDWKKAKALFRRAIEQDRNDPQAQNGMAWYFSRVEGRSHEALESIADAQRVDPERFIHHLAASAFYRDIGRLEEAIRIIEPFPFATVSAELGVVYLQIGRYAEAEASAREAMRSSPEKAWNATLLVMALAGLNKKTEARRHLSDLEERAETGIYLPSGEMALAYASLGDTESAYRWLENGLKTNGDWSMLKIRTIRSLEVLSEDPRYWQIVEAMNFPPLPIEHPFFEKEQQMRFRRTSNAGSGSYSINLPDEAPLALPQKVQLGVGGNRTPLALSPDGSLLVYVAWVDDHTQLYRRSMDEDLVMPIARTEGAVHPFFSPDGKNVGFFIPGQLKKVALEGEVVTPLSPARNPTGAFWHTDGKIYFADREGFVFAVVSAVGGNPEVLCSFGPPAQGIVALPGRGFMVGTGAVPIPTAPDFLFNKDYLPMVALSVPSGDLLQILPQGYAPALALKDVLCFARRGNLYAAAIDEQAIVMGPTQLIATGVMMNAYAASAQYTLSGDGKLVYVPGGQTDHAQFGWIDPSNDPSPKMFQPLNINRIQTYGSFQLSPDGKRLAATVAGATDQIVLYDVERGTERHLITTGSNGGPVWLPDGKSILYKSNRGGITSLRRANVDTIEEESEEMWVEDFMGAFSCFPDSDGPGYTVLLMKPTNAGDLYSLHLPSLREEKVAATSAFEWGGKFSPDGKLIAYVSDTSGTFEIWVKIRGSESLGEQVSSSIGGAEEPVWVSKNNKQVVYFRSGERWFSCEVGLTDGELKLGETETLFSGPYVNIPGISFDVHPDGRVLVLQSVNQADTTTELKVITGLRSKLEAIKTER